MAVRVGTPRRYARPDLYIFGEQRPVAVKIKLKRLGKIRNPQYRIVVADSRTKRDGRAIEEIGRYEPKQDPSLIEVDSDRVQYWLGVGAQPTEAVRALLRVTGDWQKFTQEPGSEGTLRVKEAKADKSLAYASAVEEAAKIGDQPAKPKLAPKSEDVADAKKAEAAEIAEGNAEVAELAEAETAAEELAEAADEVADKASEVQAAEAEVASDESGTKE